MLLKSLVQFASLVSIGQGVKVNPLPKPRSIQWGSSGVKTLSENLVYDGPDNKIVKEAYKRAIENIISLEWIPVAVEHEFIPVVQFEQVVEFGLSGQELDTVKVEVADLEADLQHGVDESYTLQVAADSSEIEIIAETVWGVLHAFNTLRQIVIFDETTGKFIIEEPVVIEDAPLYPHRGIMVDTGRHFYPVSTIMKHIDALEMSKMNIFHWHFEDATSWPLYIPSFPNMTKDAYSRKEIYSTQDVKTIVEYAKARGVRVIPEIDIPGHSFSGWKQTDPEVMACATSEYSNNINSYQLDILYPGTYDVLETVYNDLSEIFPDNFFHMGNDELETTCFDYSKHIQEWLAEDPIRTHNDVLEYWVDHALPIMNQIPDRRLIMWEDAVLSDKISAKNIPKNVIMQSWNNGTKFIQELVHQGYDVIVSSADFYYLDCGFSGYVSDDPRYDEQEPTVIPSFNYEGSAGSWCGPYKSWQRMYTFDFDQGLTEEEKKKILGAEAAMWSEQADETVSESKIWPRTAALAELVWSGNRDENGNKRAGDLTQRIMNFREFMVANGISAAPLMPKYCIQHPHACDYHVYTGL